MALPFCCSSKGCFPSRLLAVSPSPTCRGLLLSVHRQQHSRDSSSSWKRSSGVAVINFHLGWGEFQHPNSSSKVVMASTNPTFGVADVDLKTDDFSTLKLPLPDKQVLAGVGTMTLNFLATVASFPYPDSKIRSVEALSQGGGNVGNALTAAARLGLRPRIFSKLAKDAAGVGCCKEVEANGVDVSHIVCRKTRTCIHTPGYPPFIPEELSPLALSTFLNGVDLVYLDARIPEATLLIANEARRRQLPIIVDAERKGEKLDEILTFADYLVTSAKFPQIWTEASTLAEGLISLAVLLPRLKFITGTQGSKGRLMLERSSSEVVNILDPNSTLLSPQKEAEQLRTSKPMVFSSKVS